jgi:hypothetical protein
MGGYREVAGTSSKGGNEKMPAGLTLLVVWCPPLLQSEQTLDEQRSSEAMRCTLG